MASSASDAGHSERDIREKLIKKGAVDVMLAIGNNFFYTRSLPCTLWFFDRAKEAVAPSPSERAGVRSSNTVLMLDARKIYHKVTQKINDFSPEQLQNIICIVNLYRGNIKKFASTVKIYLETSAEFAKETATASQQLQTATQAIHKQVSAFAKTFAKENKEAKTFVEQLTLEDAANIYGLQTKLIEAVTLSLSKGKADIDVLENISHLCKGLRKPQDKFLKQIADAISFGVKEFALNKNADWKELKIKEQLDQLKTLQQQLSGNPDEDELGLLHEVEYFYKQAHWLTSRFPDGKFIDVEGLCKVVTQKDIAAKDFSLSPGRYVGVDAAVDDGIDYEERLNEIHIELDGLNEEATQLANSISENFKEVVV